MGAFLFSPHFIPPIASENKPEYHLFFIPDVANKAVFLQKGINHNHYTINDIYKLNLAVCT